jgi:hypothetical protein
MGLRSPMKPHERDKTIDSPWSATRFNTWGRGAATAMLVATVGLMAWCLATPVLRPWQFGDDALLDLHIYRGVVERVRSGQDYYDAAATYLTAATSVFNWRLPTYAWGLSVFPDPLWAFVLLVALAVAAVLLTSVLIQPAAGRVVVLITTVLLLGGTFGWSFYEPDAFYATEPWCEVLLLLSVCAYAGGCWPAGCALGLAALLVRELALPYCGVALLLAVWGRRWREVAAWVAGLSILFWLFSWHRAAVAAVSPASEVGQVGQWLNLETWGMQFLLTSCQMNVFLRALPPWVIALYLPLSVLGLAGWHSAIGNRIALTTAAYVVPFVIVSGWSYWGFFYTPFLVLGILRAPAALRDLIKALRYRAGGARPDWVVSSPSIQKAL